MPPGWPTPTDRWILANALWQPAEGWVPLPDLRPAPEGWRFWVPNPEWRRRFGSIYRGIAPWARAARLLVMVWIVIVVVGVFLPDDVGPAIAAGVVALAALGCVIVHTILRRRVTRRGMDELRGIAAAAREHHLIRLYQRYLRDAA